MYYIYICIYIYVLYTYICIIYIYMYYIYMYYIYIYIYIYICIIYICVYYIYICIIYIYIYVCICVCVLYTRFFREMVTPWPPQNSGSALPVRHALHRIIPRPAHEDLTKLFHLRGHQRSYLRFDQEKWQFSPEMGISDFGIHSEKGCNMM